MENNYWDNLNVSETATEQNSSAEPSFNSVPEERYTPGAYGIYNIPAAPSKKKQKKRQGFSAVLIIICLIVSIAGGYFGGILANNSREYPQTTLPPGVFYQSVDKTSEPVASRKNSSIKEVVKKIQDSVVEVFTEEPVNSPFFEQYVETGAGSGVIISKDGYIVTCAHVVQGSNNIKVALTNGDTYDATVIGAPDDVNDIAVLKIDGNEFTAAVFGDSDKLSVGDEAIVIGNPLGSLGGTVTNGIISALERDVIVEGSPMTLLQTNAAINPGNSGGGIFNISGELIGLINAKSIGQDIEGIGFAIPINLVKNSIEQLMEKGFVSAPAIGISAMWIYTQSAADEYGVERFGVYVDALTPGKGAETAGLLPGDYILSIGDAPIDSLSDISTVLKDYSVGDSIEIQVIRNDEILTFSVVLSERNT